MNIDTFYKLVSPFSMTSKERIVGLYESLEHVRKNNIDGDIVECGVWKGGNILGILEYLEYFKIYNKSVWLFDTFKGMTNPTDVDIDLNGNRAFDILQDVMCISTIDEVQKTLSLSNFPKEKIRIIEGDVCETLKFQENIPTKISILRLDTDFYESTKMELNTLYPNLTKNGILIVDDYGHWLGSKKAFDDYFQNQQIQKNILDYTGIKIVKS